MTAATGATRERSSQSTQIAGGRGGNGGDGGYVYANIVVGDGAGYRVPSGGFSGINNEPGGAGGAGGRGTGILGFAPDGSNGSNRELWLQSVPEPASLSLLVFGAVALFRRQRA